MRTFRLDRIREIRLLTVRFRIPASLSLDRYLQDTWSDRRGERTHEVILRFDAELAPLMESTQHHAGEEIRPLDNGELEYRVHVSYLDEIARWIVGFGGRCRVAEPEVLQGMVYRIASQAAHANAAAGGDADATRGEGRWEPVRPDRARPGPSPVLAAR
ncbi:MAG: helix-turn-helix transcriptional regulator [Thermoanaerobaculia bacterium]